MNRRQRTDTTREIDRKEYNPLAGLNRTSFTSNICRHTTTHDRASLFVLDTFGDTCGVTSVAEGVLLEGTRGSEAGILLFGAMELVGAVGAEFTLATDTPDPFDACSVAHLPLVVHVVAHGHDDTGALVACDALGRGLHGYSERGPFVVDE